MTPEEVTYLAVLLCSIPAGLLFKGRGPRWRQWVGTGLGVGLTLVTCGPHALHSLVTALGTWVVLRAVPRRCGAAAMLWTFGYLLFFRTPELWGLPEPPPYANALQLLLTLKMVSMASDVQDLREAGPKGVTSEEADEMIGGLKSCPGLVEILCYSYCYLGLLTGPFYRLSTYRAWLRGPLPSASLALVLQRLRWAPALALLGEAVGRLFPAEALREPHLWGGAFPRRLLATAPVFLSFRLRFYVAWLCAEASCLAAAFGAYPRAARARPGCGPTRGCPRPAPGSLLSPDQWDYECIRTVDPWGTERCRGVREGLRRWNMTVQWWLQHYVHQRTPGPPLLRAAVTVLVSAYWHGLQGGLYLTMLSLPLWLAAERAPLPPLGSLPLVPAAVGAALRRALPMRVFEYLSVGFVLRRGPDVLRYWAAVGFCLHLLPLAMVIAGALLSRSRSRSQSDGSHGDGSHGDGSHSGAHSDGSHRDGTHSDETHSDETHRDATHRDGTHSGTHSNGSHGDETHRDGTHRDGSHRDDTHRDETHSGTHSDGTHRDGTDRDETHRDATHRDATHRDATQRDGSRRDETHRDATHRDATHRDATQRDGSRRDETRRDETHRDGTHRDETHRDATQRDGTHSDGSHRDETHRDETYSSGSHRDGTHRDGSHRDVTDRDETHSRTHSNGSHRDGTHRDGIHRDGAQSTRTYSDGARSDGCHSNGSHSDGSHSDGRHSNGSHSDGSHSDGTHSDGCHSNGSHSEGCHSNGSPSDGGEGVRRRRGPGGAGRGEEEEGGHGGTPPEPQ